LTLFVPRNYYRTPTPNLINGPIPGKPAPDKPHVWTPGGLEIWICSVCGTKIYTGLVKEPRNKMGTLDEVAGATCAASLVAEVMRS
jgi:hypothetical protein